MRESFVIHSEYITDLPEEFRMKYLAFIFNYGIFEIVPKVTGLEKTIWQKIQRRMDTDIQSYENKAFVLSLSNEKRKLQAKLKNADETEKQFLENRINEINNSLYQAKDAERSRTEPNGTRTEPVSDSLSLSLNLNDSLSLSLNDSVSVSDNVFVVVSDNEQSQTTTTKDFQIPTLKEVKKYCQERYSNIDAEKFFDYYEANGWKLGKHRMKDWKAAVRVWESKSE